MQIRYGLLALTIAIAGPAAPAFATAGSSHSTGGTQTGVTQSQTGVGLDMSRLRQAARGQKTDAIKLQRLLTLIASPAYSSAALNRWTQANAGGGAGTGLTPSVRQNQSQSQGQSQNQNQNQSQMPIQGQGQGTASGTMSGDTAGSTSSTDMGVDGRQRQGTMQQGSGTAGSPMGSVHAPTQGGTVGTAPGTTTQQGNNPGDLTPGGTLGTNGTSGSTGSSASTGSTGATGSTLGTGTGSTLGGAQASMPGVIVTPVSSVVGDSPRAIATFTQLANHYNPQISSLRTAIGNNAVLLSALNNSSVDVNAVVAVDVLPTGGIEVFTLQ